MHKIEILYGPAKYSFCEECGQRLENEVEFCEVCNSSFEAKKYYSAPHGFNPNLSFYEQKVSFKELKKNKSKKRNPFKHLVAPPSENTDKNNININKLDYTGFWKRTGAYLIDCCIYFGLLAIATGISNLINYGAIARNQFLFILMLYFIGWLYFAGMESSEYQATFGKKALGIKVVNEKGNQISLKRATWRFLSKTLSGISLLIGFIMAGFTEKSQALHDMLADTLVINNER